MSKTAVWVGVVLAAGFCNAAALLDRVELVIDRQVVTELQLEEEMRVTAFLNDSPVEDGASQRRAATSRLIDQALLQQEMHLSHYGVPEENAIDAAVATLQNQEGAAVFEAKLAKYHLSLAQIRQHLANQAATLRFVEIRFRPAAAVSEADLQAAYSEYSSQWKNQHPEQSAPTLEQSRAALRRELSEERTDRALDEWLKEASRSAVIVYLDPALSEPLR